MKLPSNPLTWAIAAVAVLAIAGAAYFVIYRLVFQGQDLAKEKANRIVTEEQIKAEAGIVDKTLTTVHEREIYREQVNTTVREATMEIDNAWNGDTVGDAVDAAGADALCQLHDNLCRFAPAEAM